jgi:sensor histidine kinase YesM
MGYHFELQNRMFAFIMQKKISTYWICQLGGWGLSFAIFCFFYLTLSLKHIDNFFLLIFINTFLGILFTHLMRIVIKEYKFLQMPIRKQIFSFISTTILFSFAYASADVGIDKFFHLGENIIPKISTINEILRTTINNCFFLVIWNLIYFIYHYIERNRTQELQTLKLQSMVKELELKTIKAHINPHFIFNALNSIRSLVDENPSRARTAITELSNILRSSMQAEKMETVPLERELNIVKDYLALEKMRFEERLNIELQINPDTLEMPVPPMMLQTLVENAIKHGVSRNVNGGLIKITSDFSNHHHEIVVLNSGQLNGYYNGDGFGVKSTQDRLNMLYQGKASFVISNLDVEMVESKIIMPLSNY